MLINPKSCCQHENYDIEEIGANKKDGGVKLILMGKIKKCVICPWALEAEHIGLYEWHFSPYRL